MRTEGALEPKNLSICFYSKFWDHYHYNSLVAYAEDNYPLTSTESKLLMNKHDDNQHIFQKARVQWHLLPCCSDGTPGHGQVLIRSNLLPLALTSQEYELIPYHKSTHPSFSFERKSRQTRNDDDAIQFYGNNFLVFQVVNSRQNTNKNAGGMIIHTMRTQAYFFNKSCVFRCAPILCRNTN